MVDDVNGITGYNPDASPKYGANEIWEYYSYKLLKKIFLFDNIILN